MGDDSWLDLEECDRYLVDLGCENGLLECQRQIVAGFFVTVKVQAPSVLPLVALALQYLNRALPRSLEALCVWWLA